MDNKDEILENLLDILENSGADYVRDWAKKNILRQAVSMVEAKIVLTLIENNSDFKRKFVYDCLPEKCRVRSLGSMATQGVGFGINLLSGIVPEAKAGWDGATEDAIKEVVAKGLKLAWEVVTSAVSSNAIMSVHRARDIVHGSGIEEGDLTEEKVDDLLGVVEPFIYGGTPMFEALNKAHILFSNPRYTDCKKLLFVLSDGMPADHGNLPDFSALGVKVACCYITNHAIGDPKRLYGVEQPGWEQGSRFMFQLSSAITTQIIPRTIFVKRGWDIDICNNETKLFFQINHPDIIADICSLACDVVCCQDSLADILTSVSLDLYINKANDGFEPKRQIGGTCYANASAAVLHLAMSRIIGREGGYPDFFDLRDIMVDRYGRDGANTVRVLQEMCPQYRLHCQVVDIEGAMKAIIAKRPVLARFRLSDPEWDVFDQFYTDNPRGILSRNVLDIRRRPHGADLGGHAVVLTSFNSECLHLMNSWGTAWTDNGFFRVQNADILDLEFVDVYWTLNDLKASEIAAYEREGPKIADKLMKTLKGLNTAKYRCPLCNQLSEVTSFTGQLVQAKCPKCHGVFDTNQAGNDLALNMYLTSLCK